MPVQEFVKSPARAAPCVVLIGMAASGKTTVGKILAESLNWAFLDSDHLIEAIYGRRLQDITDELGKERFLDVEGTILSSIRANRAVIGTGGSAVYRDEAMRHLKTLGTVVYLDVPFETIERRIARNPQRGLAIAPGQTLADLFLEREERYRQLADLLCSASNGNARQCAAWIKKHLPPEIIAEA